MKISQPEGGVYSMDRLVLDGGPFPQAPPSGPYFDPELRREISVVSSGAATLNCRVFNIGNRTVSQVRQNGQHQVQIVSFAHSIPQT